MNERIRELAEQALFESDFDDEQNIKITMDIFAELLIRECCDIFVELRTRPADLAVKDVKKHFGVE